METLRRIEPLRAYRQDEIETYKQQDTGKVPEFRWVCPTDIYVDETYQRKLRKRSLLLIDSIIKRFSWRRLKPPIVVALEDGTLHCIDGQHTAIAAATLQLNKIPVVVVEADTVELRADAFVGHNRDRVIMEPIDIYKGLLKANDPDAMDIHNVCTRAGVRIHQVQMRGVTRVGDCAAIRVIGHLIKRHSPMKARRVLEALVKAGRAPIQRVEIDAVEAMMLVKCPQLDPDQMAKIIRRVGEDGLVYSRVKAASEKRPWKHTLFEAYYMALEKQREHAV